MKVATYRWEPADPSNQVDFVAVAGTDGEPFRFGEGGATRDMHVGDFWIATTPVTVAFWTHIVGDCPAIGRGPRRPLENVSSA